MKIVDGIIDDNKRVINILLWINKNVDHCRGSEKFFSLRQSPITTLKKGIGSCGDISRLFICLCKLNNTNAVRIYLFHSKDFSNNSSFHVISAVKTKNKWLFIDPVIGGIYTNKLNQIVPLTEDFKGTIWWDYKGNNRYADSYFSMLNWHRIPILLPNIYKLLERTGFDNLEYLRLPNIIERPYLLKTIIFFSIGICFSITAMIIWKISKYNKHK
jgi:hypothetical protein